MEFSIKGFRQAPSCDVLESCRKIDLYVIADFYDIAIVKTDRKKELRDVIQTVLIKQGILQSSSNVEVTEEDNVDVVSSDSVLRSLSGVNSDELKLAIQLKQLDLEIKRQEHTIQLLRFRQRKLETHADDRGSSSVKTHFDVPSTSVDYHSPSVPLSVAPGHPADFDVSRHLTPGPAFRDSEVHSIRFSNRLCKIGSVASYL